MDAIFRNDITSAALLLDAGANADAVDENGFTPLRFAAATGSADAVQLLLGRGADAKRVNKYRQSALAMAQREGSEAVASLLRLQV